MLRGDHHTRCGTDQSGSTRSMVAVPSTTNGSMAISSVGPPRSGPEPTLYEAVGGEPFFVRLVDLFYDNVEADADLLALYPEPDDLSGSRRERFRLFLCQYWGGPSTYSEQRGHPRLRMRHGTFVIDPAARDRWLVAMPRRARSDGGCAGGRCGHVAVLHDGGRSHAEFGLSRAVVDRAGDPPSLRVTAQRRR